MTTSPMTDIYDQWTRPSFYQRRVRGTAKDPTYLWGSAGITQPIPFDTPLILHIHNDTFGEPITIQTQTPGTPPKTAIKYGTLQPGECVSIPLNTISGVAAILGDGSTIPVPPESTVTCAITTSR